MFDVKSSLKIAVYISSYLVYGSAQNIDMLSTEGLFTFKKERFITTYIVDNEVTCPHKQG